MSTNKPVSQTKDLNNNQNNVNITLSSPPKLINDIEGDDHHTGNVSENSSSIEIDSEKICLHNGTSKTFNSSLKTPTKPIIDLEAPHLQDLGARCDSVADLAQENISSNENSVGLISDEIQIEKPNSVLSALKKKVKDEDLDGLKEENIFAVQLLNEKGVLVIAAFEVDVQFIKNRSGILSANGSLSDFKPIRFNCSSKYVSSKPTCIGMLDCIHMLSQIELHKGQFINSLEPGLYVFSGISTKWIKVYMVEEYADSYGPLVNMQQMLKVFDTSYKNLLDQKIEKSTTKQRNTRFTGRYVCSNTNKTYFNGIWTGSETATCQASRVHLLGKLLDYLESYNIDILGDMIALEYPNKPSKKKCLSTFFKTPNCIKIYPSAGEVLKDNSKKTKDSFDRRIRRQLIRDISYIAYNAKKDKVNYENTGKDIVPPSYCFKWENICLKLRATVLSFFGGQSNSVDNKNSEYIRKKRFNDESQHYDITVPETKNIKRIKLMNPEMTGERKYFFNMPTVGDVSYAMNSILNTNNTTQFGDLKQNMNNELKNLSHLIEKHLINLNPTLSTAIAALDKDLREVRNSVFEMKMSMSNIKSTTSKDNLKDLFKEVSKDLTKDLSKDITKELTKDLSKDITKELTKDLSKDITKELTKDLSKDITKELTKDLSKDITKDLTKDLSKDITKELTNEILKDLSKDLSQDISKILSKDLSQDITKMLSKDLASNISKDLFKDLSKEIKTQFQKNSKLLSSRFQKIESEFTLVKDNSDQYNTFNGSKSSFSHHNVNLD